MALFTVITIIWFSVLIKISYKPTYILMFSVFFVYIACVLSIEFIKTIKIKKVKSFYSALLTLAIILSLLPFLRLITFPLTWEKSDTYDFNKELIVKNIPQGSTVITDVRFWHALVQKNKTFDAHFSNNVVEFSDFVLLNFGGSGNPGIPYFELWGEDADYFFNNFQRKYSSFIDEPNQLLGIDIARSRWSYGFDLYEKNHSQREPYNNKFEF